MNTHYYFLWYAKEGDWYESILLPLVLPPFLLGFRWTYADPSWARVAALVPEVVSCAEAGDEVAHKILSDAVEELALTVNAVVQRLGLAGEGVTSLNS